MLSHTGHPGRIRRLVALATATALFAGCARMPNRPSAEIPADGGTVGHSTSASSASLGSVTGGLITTTVEVTGTVGGVLNNGRWQLRIPSGAISGSATVSLGVLSAKSTTCDLEITPADKNSFAQPVTLTANCNDVSLSKLRGAVINWYDPATGRWVPVPGSKVDLTMRTVSAPLHHFSKYSVGPQGKAGW